MHKARKYNPLLYLGYRLANDKKYPAMPHQQACKNGRLVNRAMFKKKDTSYVCCAFTVIWYCTSSSLHHFFAPLDSAYWKSTSYVINLSNVGWRKQKYVFRVALHSAFSFWLQPLTKCNVCVHNCLRTLLLLAPCSISCIKSHVAWKNPLTSMCEGSNPR